MAAADGRARGGAQARPRARGGDAGSTPAASRPGEDRFEERVRWAASEVVAHLDAGYRVGLRTDHDHIAPDTSARHRARLLGFLALVEPRVAQPEPVQSARAPLHEQAP